MSTDFLRQALKDRVNDSDYSMKGLSRAIGHGETLVRDIITGRTKNPSNETIAALAAKLGCSVQDLYGSSVGTGAYEAVLAPSSREEIVQESFPEIEEIASAPRQAPATKVSLYQEPQGHDHDPLPSVSCQSKKKCRIACLVNGFVALVLSILGAYLMLKGYIPSSGEFTVDGVAYPAKGASFHPETAALGFGFIFAAFRIAYRHRD